MTGSQIQIALAGVLPALVAMWFVDRLDRQRPEPRRLRRLVAVAGMLSVIPALVLEVGLTRTPPEYTYQGASFRSFLAAGVEEACKVVIIFWIVWRRPALDERMVGIVHASRAGLGFALVVNVMYLPVVARTVDDQLPMWILHAVLSVPGHAMWTGMIGALAARRRFDGRGLGLLGGYLLAVAFHGTYDLALGVQRPMLLEGHGGLAWLLMGVPIGLTVLAFFVLRSMARTALRLDDVDAANAAARAAARIRGVASSAPAEP
ncbi:MAG: PrsW family intramembrane metalloprotease [Myxococcota bacterium]|nr:PrsW family intramembrane metalloprotease [Myxococcota bacterium]